MYSQRDYISIGNTTIRDYIYVYTHFTHKRDNLYPSPQTPAKRTDKTKS